MQELADLVFNWADNKGVRVSIRRENNAYVARLTFEDALGPYGWSVLLGDLKRIPATKKRPLESDSAWQDRVEAALREGCVGAHRSRLKFNAQRLAA
jgi:hypothetical protein